MDHERRIKDLEDQVRSLNRFRLFTNIIMPLLNIGLLIQTYLKDRNLAQCPNCGNIVQKSDNYCGSCGKRLFLTVSLKNQ